MSYLFYDSTNFKILGYTDDPQYVIPDGSVLLEISDDDRDTLLKTPDTIILDSETPDDFTKIKTEIAIFETPPELLSAIERGEKVQKTNEAIEFLARYQALQLASSLGNNELLTLAPLYPDWVENFPYVAGDPINYNGVLFKVKQSHTSQIDWLPENTPALYVKVTPDGMILEFGKNPDGTDRDLTNNPYTIGERCTWQGLLYESIFEGNNIWSPADYPAGWKEVT